MAKIWRWGALNILMERGCGLANVDAKERIDHSLVEILKLKFGRDFEPEYLSRY